MGSDTGLVAFYEKSIETLDIVWFFLDILYVVGKNVGKILK